MHLIYLDESGNSGTNLLDPQQPIFVLGALPIPEEKWRNVVAETGELKKSLSEKIGRAFEIHAHEISSGRGDFRKSLPLQLADLCVYYARKAHERKLGLPPRSIDDEAIARIEKLSEGQSSGHPHALAWLERQPPQMKGAARSPNGARVGKKDRPH